MPENQQCLLSGASANWPYEPFLINGERTYRFHEAESTVRSMTRNLSDLGLTSGCKVAISAPLTIEYPLLLLALVRLGAIACPVNERFPASYLTERLTSIGCGKLITDRTNIDPGSIEIIRLENAIAASDIQCELPDYDFDRPATIIFSSGSQGNPRGIVHSINNHRYNALGSNENIKLAPDDRWLLSLPLFHVGGLAIIFRSLLSGAAAVIPEPDSDLIEQIERHKITHLSVVPTQLKQIIEHPESSALSFHLKALLLGGGPTPDWLVQASIEKQLPLFRTYGLTEMGSQVATSRPDAAINDLADSGELLNYRELRIDKNGRISVRGKTRFLGCATKSEIETPFDDEGWFETSDIGELDKQGRLKIIGRADNLFISGGENVQPERIEAEVQALTRAEKVAVVPVDDRKFGKRPVAFIDGPFEESVLLNDLRGRLPAYMIPKKLFPWPDHADDKSLKFDREYLRRQAEQKIAQS